MIISQYLASCTHQYVYTKWELVWGWKWTFFCALKGWIVKWKVLHWAGDGEANVQSWVGCQPIARCHIGCCVPHTGSWQLACQVGLTSCPPSQRGLLTWMSLPPSQSPSNLLSKSSVGNPKTGTFLFFFFLLKLIFLKFCSFLVGWVCVCVWAQSGWRLCSSRAQPTWSSRRRWDFVHACALSLALSLSLSLCRNSFCTRGSLKHQIAFYKEKLNSNFIYIKLHYLPFTNGLNLVIFCDIYIDR